MTHNGNDTVIRNVPLAGIWPAQACRHSILLDDLHGGNRRRPAWNHITCTADAFNEPGEFTALIGWEWSSMKNGSNLHRVVFTPDAAETAQQLLPFSQFESSDPEDLWRWLDGTQATTGARFVAMGLDLEDVGKPAFIQERGYSSPIGYEPGAIQ